MKRIDGFARFATVIVVVTISPWLAAQSSVTTPSPDVFIKTGDTTTSSLKVFNSLDTELLRVTATGSAVLSGPMRATSFGAGGTAPAGYQFFSTSSAEGVSSAFQLHSSFTGTSTSFIGNYGNYGTYIVHNRDPQNGTFVNAAAPPYQWKAAQVMVGDTIRGRIFQVSSYTQTSPIVEVTHMLVNYDGFVGIGTTTPSQRLHVEGNIHVSGNINAKFQDMAEWVPSSTDLRPGSVVVLDPAIGNGVMASGGAYDTTVAGVVSAQPGIVLGEAGADKEQIATTGRVRVRVDATSAPIRVGDLLVTSDKPGMAMRSEPMEIGGRKFHQPGTILGKALEPLESGEGEILVLLSLQ